ncbi:hypothetical protein Ngar_c21780 [Candidatus Nitrososphaera gargensis Ga9.2]|uniref:Response regulatory domain-containing protein n=2 Tax=Candidatus Nitrososphaera gargensis TaxID=497727 RepID=K0IJ25_NITGG|nr:hypothetical protein Ngar_c21780 [Candidatus Nitrososphaera gargensis Ga9.2]
MKKTSNNNLLHASDRQHLMLLYDNESERHAAEIACINEALKLGEYCMYASVDLHDRNFASKLASKIHDYDRHIKEGNLWLVDFMPFYESALNADLMLFNELKKQIEAKLKGRIASRKSSKVLIVADAACNLTKHMQFDECIALESWWQETYIEWARRNLDITIICAHPSLVLEQDYHSKNHISQSHSLTIDLQQFSKPIIIGNRTRGVYKPKASSIRILVAEPEPDMQTVYKEYLGSLPIDAVIARNGRECLERILTPGSKERFDMIIIDSHLKDIN